MFDKVLVGILTAGLFILTAIVHNGYAYDSDVDFSAPYITLDPETGKLVTVDPTQEIVPRPHQLPQPTTNPTTIVSDKTAPIVSEKPLLEGWSLGTIVAGTAVALIAMIAGVIAVKRKQAHSNQHT